MDGPLWDATLACCLTFDSTSCKCDVRVRRAPGPLCGGYTRVARESKTFCYFVEEIPNG